MKFEKNKIKKENFCEENYNQIFENEFFYLLITLLLKKTSKFEIKEYLEKFINKNISFEKFFLLQKNLFDFFLNKGYIKLNLFNKINVLSEEKICEIFEEFEDFNNLSNFRKIIDIAFSSEKILLLFDEKIDNNDNFNLGKKIQNGDFGKIL